jgi:8-oxo-dGTP pyrophosphatase MutT (NUDIX family)
MERIDSRVVYEGRIATVRVDRIRYADGSTSEREVVEHPGAVAVIAHDDLHVYLVRQPREAVGEEALLELPAGKLDVPGEAPLECARRELAEEIGKSADEWSELKRFYTTPGFAAEQVTVFLATGLRDAEHEPDPEERIEIVPWPLSDLDHAIESCEDSKSLIGLMMFAELRRGERG